MAKKSYDKAFLELQKLLDELQGETTSVDKLGVKVKKAQELLSFCKTRLREVETEVSDKDISDEEE